MAQDDKKIELIFQEGLQEVFDDFTAVTGTRMSFFSPEGQYLCGGSNDLSSYCALVRDEIFSHEACHELDREKQLECQAARKTICYACHAGLKEIMTPIFVDGRIAGFVCIGQFRTSKRIPDDVLNACSDKNSARNLCKHFARIPYLPPERCESLLGLLSVMVDHIVSRELIRLRRDILVEKIGNYIDARISKPLKLSDAAKHFRRSESGISHILKERSGKTFRQIIIEKRLAFAETLLKDATQLNINEVALRSGFNDPFHFSKLFRKHKGLSPREYRKQCLS